MRTIIAGSRSITDMRVLDEALFVFHKTLRIATVISGGAFGVDRLGEQWARRENKPLEIYPAEWSRLGITAGFVRNVEMAELADALLAIWDGESRGTWHMILTAVRKGLTVFIWNTKTGKPMPPPQPITEQYQIDWAWNC